MFVQLCSKSRSIIHKTEKSALFGIWPSWELKSGKIRFIIYIIHKLNLQHQNLRRPRGERGDYGG